MTSTTLVAPPLPRLADRLDDAEPSASMLAVRDFAPFAISLIPFSLAIGTAAAMNGLTLVEAGFGAVVLLAGTAQLAANELVGANGGIAIVVVTVVLINARFMIYGAGLARWFADAPVRQRLVLAFPLVDQSFLCCEERFVTMTNVADRRRYYVTGSAMLMVVFLTSELIGFLAGPLIPAWLGLHLAAPLAFAGMLMKSIKTTQHATVAVVAAVVVVVGSGLPAGLALPAAIAAGVIAGERVKRSEP